MKKRKICIVTGSRAEYGLLYWIIKGVHEDSELGLQLVVTGMHLSQEFGLTVKEIQQDGFPIAERVEVLISSDTEIAIATSMGIGMISFAKTYERLKPDILVVLGDRFEILSAVSAAVPFRIPVAHIHGGESSEGAMDEIFRHAITKMSHLHFTATEAYKRRVIQLGEDPDRVFNTGALGIDAIRKLKLLPKKALEKTLGFRFNRRNLLVTFHPVTLEKNSAGRQFKAILDALTELKNTNIIFTKANADSDGRIINKMIDRYVAANAGRCIAFASMGQLRYLSTMRYVDAVIGNSSSGIIEAPSLKTGTINIGDRQRGRIRAGSVIDCNPTRNDIKRALKKLYSKKFMEGLMDVINPYGEGEAAGQIARVLKEFNLNNILMKKFYDMNFDDNKVSGSG